MGGVVVPILEFGAQKNPVAAYPTMQSAAAIPAASGGGGDTESRIVQKHDRLIRYTAIPFVGHGIALDDLVQTGRLALLEASRRWDASQGVKLWTYARKFVLGDMFRLVAREINEPSRDLVAGDDGEDGDMVTRLLAAGPTPEEVAQLGEDLTILEEEIDALSADERDVLWKHFGEDVPVWKTVEGQHHSAAQRLYHGAIETLRNRMTVRA